MLDREAVDALVARRRRARAPRVHHHRRPRGDPRGQPRGLAQRVRGRRGAHVQRLVYTSSVAAYGFHADNPQPLTEDVAAARQRAHYYSAQKAELEQALREDARRRRHRGLRVPAVHRRRAATRSLLIEAIPAVVRQAPLGPVLPDPGHAVPARPPRRRRARAGRRRRAARATPGVYNLAGDGTITVADLARALGWHAVPVPRAGIALTAGVVDLLPLDARRRPSGSTPSACRW